MRMRLRTLFLTIVSCLFLLPAAYAQQSVSGKVLGEDGNGLASANVIVKGTTRGALTGDDGSFTIRASAGEVLVVSFIGYQTQEVTIASASDLITIRMAPDARMLDEVVVVGYGTQRREDLTGAISTVNLNDVESIALTSVDQAIQGRVAGVMVTNTGGGAPGGNFQVNIRGVGSINAETPLYVIDGIPIQESGASQLGTSFLASLNPNDIESIDILKDASAAAIYGARASGGVVLITTKRGQAGPVKVDFNGYYGIQTQPNTYDVLNADQYVNFLRELHSGPDGDLPPAFDGTQPPHDTDWQDSLLSNAPIQNYSVGISGGNQNATFSLGLEYFGHQGTMVGTGFERYSVRANGDYKVGSRIKVGQTLLVSRTDRTTNNGGGGRRSIEHAIKQAPTVPVRDASFLGGFGFPSVDDGQDADNPVASGLRLDNNEQTYRIWGSLYGELEILKGLTYRIQTGVDFSYGDNFTYSPAFDGVRRLRQPSTLNWNRNSNFNPLLEQFLTYNGDFGDHNLTAMAGFSVQAFRFTSVGASGQQLPEGVVSINAAAANILANSAEVETSLRSVFGRLTYSYASRYLLTANVRRDESSKLFNSTNPVGVFPSVSAGWWVSREAFMANVNAVSSLKLRGGWGLLGNQTPLSAYPTAVNLRTDFFYPFGNQVTQGISQLVLANPNINWETTRQWDFGVDLGLFRDQLLINIDYYNRTTSDLLWTAAVAPSVGLNAPFVNAGEVNNRGWEFVATYRKYEGDFTFDLSANLTTITNEVLGLGETDSTVIFTGNATDDLSNVSITRIGDPIGSFYGFQHDGIFQSWDDVYGWARINQDPNGGRDAATAVSRTAPGDLRWIDQDGDGDVDGDDRVILGSPIPDFIYGATFNAGYKNFDLQVFLQGMHGNEIFNAATRWLEDMRQNFNQGTAVLDRWQAEGDQTDIPRATRSDPNQNILRVSDRYVEDGSFMRIRNFTVGYTLPANVAEKIRANRVRVYGTIQNLATFTRYSGLEPEIGSYTSGTARDAGIDRMVYPQPRTFLIGAQLGF